MNHFHPLLKLAHDRRMFLLTVMTALAAGCHHTAAPAKQPAEQVNFGYGMEERSFSTGVLGSATVEDFREMKVAHIAQLIEGRFAGVHVQRTAGGNYSIRIRGIGSFMGNGEPLFVIDGMPVEAATAQGISWLNPADVARIDILKDAASTAMYGMRGSNGVILITTKRGR